MNTLLLKIMTPRKVVKEDVVDLVSAPSHEGEITVLPRHTRLLTLLEEGIVKIKKGTNEEHIAVGGGFLETDGKDLRLLVSRAYGQDEVDRNLTEKAFDKAKKILSESKDKVERHEASALLRRSIIDLKLLKKRRHPSSI